MLEEFLRVDLVQDPVCVLLDRGREQDQLEMLAEILHELVDTWAYQVVVLCLVKMDKGLVKVDHQAVLGVFLLKRGEERGLGIQVPFCVHSELLVDLSELLAVL